LCLKKFKMKVLPFRGLQLFRVTEINPFLTRETKEVKSQKNNR